MNSGAYQDLRHLLGHGSDDVGSRVCPEGNLRHGNAALYQGFCHGNRVSRVVQHHQGYQFQIKDFLHGFTCHSSYPSFLMCMGVQKGLKLFRCGKSLVIATVHDLHGSDGISDADGLREA